MITKANVLHALLGHAPKHATIHISREPVQVEGLGRAWVGYVDHDHAKTSKHVGDELAAAKKHHAHLVKCAEAGAKARGVKADPHADPHVKHWAHVIDEHEKCIRRSAEYAHGGRIRAFAVEDGRTLTLKTKPDVEFAAEHSVGA